MALLQRELARTVDPVERLRLQAQIEQERNSAAKTYGGELTKQLRTQESIYDALNKQRDAALGLLELQIRDRQEARKEARQLAGLARVVNGGQFSAEQRAAAQDQIDLIRVQQQQRQQKIRETSATAGGTISATGQLLQSVAGGGVPAAPAPPGAAARVATLGELAGRKRDVPDPFRMQIGAWMTYAREIDDMLRAALPAIIGRAGPAAPAPAGGVPEARRAAAERLAQLLQLAATMPDVIDWSVARGRLDGDLAACGSAPAGASDMVAAYVALLRAGLAMLPPKPAATQLGLLQRATTRLSDPVDQAALNELSAQVASLPALA